VPEEPETPRIVNLTTEPRHCGGTHTYELRVPCSLLPRCPGPDRGNEHQVTLEETDLAVIKKLLLP
jgi:hypothetical protein